MINKLLYISALIIVFSACKKDELQENYYDSPAFYITGKIDGKIVDIVAGNNDYYMYSSYEPLNNTSAEKFVGEIKNENCELNCHESVTLIFTGNQDPLENLVEESIIKKGYKQFTNPNAGNEYLVSFNPDESYTSKAVNVDYEWDFGDGTKSTDKNPSHIFIDNTEFYNVKLSVKTSKGCQSEINNRVYIKSKTTTNFLIIQTNQNLSFEPEIDKGVPKNFLWEFESGITASTPYVDFQVDPKQGIERVCLTVTDENGIKSQRCKNLILKQEYAFCAANYSFNSSIRSDPNGGLQLGTIYLKYINNKGVVYYSRPNTTNGKEFEVTSVEDYEINEQGMPTKKVTFTTNTRLYSESGESIEVNNLVGSIAVAYRGK